MNSAKALASNVLPTPVGPAKMKQPVGRLGSFSPLRLRRTALEIDLIASSWPDDAAVQILFHLHEADRSLRFVMRVSGMPVIFDTTSAMMSSSTTPSVARDFSCATFVRDHLFLLLELVGLIAQSGRLLEVLVGNGLFPSRD